jgi:hypothetical protein
MNYLIETKETFSAPTSATNRTVPLNKPVNQWKSPTRRKHARKKTNKQTIKQEDTLCSNRSLGTFFGSRFERKG